MKPSIRSQAIQEYFFSKKLAEIQLMNDAGKNVINLGIGSPDLAPDKSVLLSLTAGLNELDSFKYQSYKGIPELRHAFLSWYKTHYSLTLPEALESIPLMGSKEGIGLLTLAYLNPQDEALIPNPGYPAYASAIRIANASPVPYTLNASSNWHPNISELEKLVTPRTKVIFINYPHMPTGQPADAEKLQEVVDFANRHKLLLCNDNPYSHILTKKPFSIFSLKNAEKCCLELNSLSKSHSMAGARIGMLVGAKEILYPVFKIQSTFSSGMFKPLQRAAISALQLSPDYHQATNEIYSARKKSVHELLDLLGCTYSKKSSGLFVWAHISQGYKNGLDLSEDLLHKAHVFITPGIIFGSSGDAYIRVSLCQPEQLISQAHLRIKNQLETLKTQLS